MNDDDFSQELRGYLRRRDARVRPVHIEWPRAGSRRIARMIALATVVGVFVAGAIVAGFALLGSRSGLLTTGSQGSLGTPAARSGAAIAYDADTGQVVMFGGLGVNGSLGDTWIWNGANWAEPHLSLSPLTRFGASMVFDSKLHGLVLFGGEPDQPISTSEQRNLNATWLWTGTGWRRLDTAHIPTSNDLTGIGVLGSMAFDAATGRVVLVTLANGIHFVACSAKTWTFNGSDWRLEDPATPLPATAVAVVDEAQTGHIVAVLHARAAVVPSGVAGTSCPAGSPEARVLPQSSTWRWTGSNWVEISSGTEPEGSALATTPIELDPVSGAAMVVTDNNEQLWSWDGVRWAEVPGSGTGPVPRAGSMQTIDGEGRVVLYGGVDQRSNAYEFDTWVWNGSRWQRSVGPAPQTSTPSPVSFTLPPS
jgi:Galactose oxidase, central domain